jgi:hypothetical protein
MVLQNRISQKKEKKEKKRKQNGIRDHLISSQMPNKGALPNLSLTIILFIPRPISNAYLFYYDLMEYYSFLFFFWGDKS